MANYTSAYTGAEIDAALAAAIAFIDWPNPVAINTATTLTIGKHHVISDLTSPANYTVTLPAASGNAGNSLSYEMASSLTKLVTVDGNSTELIDGQQTRIHHAKETAILYCNGTGWTKIAGKTIPMMCAAENQAATTVNSATITKIPVASLISESPTGMHDSGNSRINILRTGSYHIEAMVSYEKIGEDHAGAEAYCFYGIDTESTLPSSPSGAAVVPVAAVDGSSLAHVPIAVTRTITAGSYVSLIGFQVMGVTATTRTTDVVRPRLVIMEIPTW